MFAVACHSIPSLGRLSLQRMSWGFRKIGGGLDQKAPLPSFGHSSETRSRACRPSAELPPDRRAWLGRWASPCPISEIQSSLNNARNETRQALPYSATLSCSICWLRVSGAPCRSFCAVSCAPHPDPLPASGAREHMRLVLHPSPQPSPRAGRGSVCEGDLTTPPRAGFWCSPAEAG